MKRITHDGVSPNALVLSIEHNIVNQEPIPNTFITDQSIPQIDDVPGMQPTLYVKLNTQELFFNYSRPETLQDQVQRLQNQQSIMKNAMDDLIMGGAL
ncbi:hypothetical protein ABIC86_000110 [Paenibacillus sp. DS2363]|uniref:hypothetical protein n=1 Tax=Paenibacillus sp. DS2363 TaxID=3156427 RepID=UPI001AE2ACA3